MQPLSISRYSLVNSLGGGAPATLAGLRDGNSGLAPCNFETVTLDTYIGEVRGLDSRTMPPALAAYDCRNNRLALMGLEQDGFAAAVADACERYGADRIGVFMGTSTSGILETELAYR